LYLLLTGRRPFSAHTIHGFMEKHLHQRPRSPKELVGDVPDLLEAICLRLLEKAPEDRFASASHLLHVLGDAQGVDLPDRWPPSTVGRTLLKARLREAVSDVASGRKGAALLLSGTTGVGKSRLLELAERYAHRLGLPAAIGRCRLHGRPFGAFASIYGWLRTDQPAAVLEQVFRGSFDDRVIERYPVLSAFREIVIDAAPIVIAVDDIDRADLATVELLGYLIRNTLELASEPVLFLLGHDSSEHAIREQLESLPPVEVIEIPLLDAAEVEELVVSVLGSDPASLALAKRLHKEGTGSPAFIADMLRGLIDDGQIVEERSGVWRLTVAAADITKSRLPMPASLRQSLEDRLEPLSPDALTLGRVLALSRRRLDLDVLVEAAPFPEDRVMAALDELADASIVEEHRTSDAEQVDLAHGRFREVLVQSISEDDLRLGHRRLGEAIERYHRGEIGTVVEELAWHFGHAGLPAKSYWYLLATAQHHLQRSLYQESLEFLDRAVALEPEARASLPLEEADRRLAEVDLAISRARLGLGQLQEAVSATLDAQRLARVVRDPRLESRVATELGTQLRQQGHLAAALEQLELAVRRAEESGDQTLLIQPLYEIGSVRWAQGNLAGAEQHWRRVLQLAQQVGDERAQGRGFNGLGLLAVCRGQAMEARRLLEQSAASFERLGMLSALVITRVNLVELYSNTGLLRKALTLAERTLAQAEEAGHPQGIALGKAWRARVELLLQRVDEAEHDARDALRQARRLASTDDELFALSVLLHTSLARGDGEAALHHADALLDGVMRHDPEGILREVRALRAQALAAIGRTAEAQAALDLSPIPAGTWPHIQVRTDLAIGRALRAIGRPADARSALLRSLAGAEANGFRTFQLLSHAELARTTDDDASRDRHTRVAGGLARSLAANLRRDDATRFLAAWSAPSDAPPPDRDDETTDEEDDRR
jgi:tetratricopeptide (TPR) repeat protein